MNIYFSYINYNTLSGNHLMSFNSKGERNTYFTNHGRYSCTQNFQPSAFMTELIVPLEIEKTRQVNYLYFYYNNNQDAYFYHIIRCEYNTATSSKLTLKLDVFTTYQFDITFKPSFVERCHVDRWERTGIPKHEITGEPFGEFDKTIIHTQTAPMNDGCYIYTSVNPLGKLAYRPSTGTGGGGGGGTHGGGCGDYTLGIPSKNGFLFIKGFEGLAQYAHNIGDGVLTIGYGCTDRYDTTNYNQLKANEPVSDELASEVFANSVVENYGIPLINQLEADGIVVVQHEFDALLSFVYNAGLGSLTGSSIYSNLLNGNKQQACQSWLTTNILPGSQFESGLRERRQSEANIFLSGQYDIRDTLIYGVGGSISGTLYTSTSSVPPLIENTCSSTEKDFVNEATEDDLGNVWQFPVKGTVSATFPTYPDGTTHSGIDIAGNDGLKIRSSGVGTVIYVGTDISSGYGNYVIVQMTNGTQHWFGHMKTTPYVKVGDSVNHQSVLGIVGSTGNSSGPHVHWEIRTSPYAYDFTCWVNPSPRTKVGDIITGVGD